MKKWSMLLLLAINILCHAEEATQNTSISPHKPVLQIINEGKSLSYEQGSISFGWMVTEAQDYDKSWHKIISNRTADGVLMLYKTPLGQLTFVIRDMKENKITVCDTPISSLPLNKKLYLTITWNKDKLRIFVNGKMRNEKQRNDNLAMPVSAISIGGPFGATPDSIFSTMSDLKICKQALAKEEISQTYKINNNEKNFSESAGFQADDNLIQDFTHAAVIVSSTINPLRNDLSMLQDDDDNTFFQANILDKEPFIEIRHRFATQIKAIVMKLSSPVDKSLSLKIFKDGQWQDLIAKISSPATGIVVFSFDQPVKTDRYRIMLNTETKVAELAVFGDKAPRLQATKEVVAEHLIVKNINASANLLKNGDNFQLKVQFQPLSSNYGDVTLVVQVGPKELEPNFTDLALSKDCKVINTQELTSPLVFNLSIPQYALSGEYNITIKAAAKKGTIPIKYEILKVKVEGNSLKYDENDFPQAAIVKNQLTINGKAVSPLMLTFGSISMDRFIAYRDTNIKIYQIQNLGAPLLYGSKTIEEDFASSCAVIDQDIRAALSVTPDAYIIVLPCTRPRAPWNDKNPNEMVITADGKNNFHSFSSKKWLDIEKQGLCYLVNYLRRQPYASRIIGISPYFGRGGDGWAFGIEVNVYKKRAQALVGDYSAIELENFHSFLREKYANNQKALQEAWIDPKVTFDTANYSSTLLADTENFTFRNMHTPGARAAADYWEFHSSTVADAILACAAAVKTASERKLLYSVHYSYTGQILINWTAGFGQVSGALFLRKMLESADVDILCSGISGNLKVQGKMVDYPHPLGSLALHNKKSVLETDLRTYLVRTSGTYSYYQHYSKAETLTVIKRDFAVALIHGCGSRYYDMQTFSMPTLGNVPWLMDEDIISMIAKNEDIYRKETVDPSKSAAEIAVIVDTEVGFYQDIYAAAIYRNLSGYMREELCRLGAPMDFFLSCDLEKVLENKQYKLIIGLNTFQLSEKQRQKLAEVRQAGKTSFLWFFAPGFLNERGYDSLAYMREATGINFKMAGREEILSMKIDNKNYQQIFSVATKIDELRSRSWDKSEAGQEGVFGSKIGPVFYVEDQDAVTLGRHQSDNTVAFAVKKSGFRYDFYSAIPFLNADILRNIARLSGVHIYSDDGLLFDANSRYVTMHNGALKKKIKITLPEKADSVSDVFTSRIFSKDDSKFELELAPFETILWEINYK